MLSQVEELGIRIVMMARTGQLKSFNCSFCSEDLQKMRNCNGDSQSEIPIGYIPNLGQFYVCPLRCISETIQDFFKKYDYYEKYPSAYQTKYEDCNPKYYESVQLYERLMVEYEHEMHEKYMAEMNKKK